MGVAPRAILRLDGTAVRARLLQHDYHAGCRKRGQWGEGALEQSHGRQGEAGAELRAAETAAEQPRQGRITFRFAEAPAGETAGVFAAPE